jgi:hypothetical protein
VGQYPNPYSPPDFPGGLGQSPPNPLAPARRVAIMLFVIAALALLNATCTGISTLSHSDEQIDEVLKVLPKTPQGPLFTASMVRTVQIASAVIMFVGGAVLLLLGIFVRRANKAALVFATILCGLALALVGICELAYVLGALFINPMFGIFACMGLIPVSMLGLTVLWLVQALRALPAMEAARQRGSADSAAYQNYGPAGGGYAPGIVPPPGDYGQPYGMPGPGGTQSPGYGAMPAKPPADQGPPVRHPPLPPDEPGGKAE